MSKNQPATRFIASPNAKLARPKARAKVVCAKPKASLTPEQERYVDESFQRFDALYKKLAE